MNRKRYQAPGADYERDGRIILATIFIAGIAGVIIGYTVGV